MLRKYGTPPYHLVLLHGGPGAIGSLNPLAEELAARYDLGVLERVSRFLVGIGI